MGVPGMLWSRACGAEGLWGHPSRHVLEQGCTSKGPEAEHRGVQQPGGSSLRHVVGELAQGNATWEVKKQRPNPEKSWGLGTGCGHEIQGRWWQGCGMGGNGRDSKGFGSQSVFLSLFLLNMERFTNLHVIFAQGPR